MMSFAAPRILARLIPGFVVLLFGVALAAPAARADQPLAWVIEGDSATVYLLGSIHLLPESAGPMPERVDRLYDKADALVMELDMTRIDPIAFQSLVAELGQTTDERRLRDYMDESTWEQARALAAEANLSLEMLAGAKPWLAALTVTQMRLMQLGYSPEFGLELQLTRRAVEDEKPIHGLETAEQQLRAFDGLAADEQVALLMESLGEAATIEAEMAQLVAAWQRGDETFLERDLLGSMRSSEGLYQAVVVDRNRAWLDDIEGLLEQDGTHLVIVGTLHLVGEDSLIRMLRGRGVEATAL